MTGMKIAMKMLQIGISALPSNFAHAIMGFVDYATKG